MGELTELAEKVVEALEAIQKEKSAELGQDAGDADEEKPAAAKTERPYFGKPKSE